MTDFYDVLNTALLTFRSSSDFIKALILLTLPATALSFYALRIWSRNSRAQIETRTWLVRSAPLRRTGRMTALATFAHGRLTAIARRPAYIEDGSGMQPEKAERGHGEGE